ncbi:ABC transporter substrate-binding protein, partial [Rickettsiaceae bacterium]|nr:ABC transporter substrate-binding protein [Rickettsiaceae bacterium]
MTYKTNILFTTIITICTILFFSNKSIAQEKIVKIYISQFVEHPALDSTARGILDGLSSAGYVNGKNADIRIESAQGNVSLAGQIANKFMSNDPDIVVGIGTISAQSFAKFVKNTDTKLIFASVTDPVEAGLIESLDKTDGNISGVSNFVPLEPQIEMFLQIKPSIKKLGFVYNPGELNSISLIEKLQAICPKYGIELITITAAKTSDVAQSATKIASMVDAIFISNDNTALSAMRMIVKAANLQKIPVFASDTDIVEQGVIAAYGPNQYEIGRQTARMIASSLHGKGISNMTTEFPDKMELFLNLKAAKASGIDIAPKLI